MSISGEGQPIIQLITSSHKAGSGATGMAARTCGAEIVAVQKEKCKWGFHGGCRPLAKPLGQRSNQGYLPRGQQPKTGFPFHQKTVYSG